MEDIGPCTYSGAHGTTTFTGASNFAQSTVIIPGITTIKPGEFGCLPGDFKFVSTATLPTLTTAATATAPAAKSASLAAAGPNLFSILAVFLLISAMLAPAAALATRTAADEESPTAIKPSLQSSFTVPAPPYYVSTTSSTATVDGGSTTPMEQSPLSPASAVKKALVTPSTIGPDGNGGITTISGSAYMTVAEYGGAKARKAPVAATYLAVTIPLVLTGCLMGMEPSWWGLGMEVGGGAMLTAVGFRLGVLA